MKKFAFRDLDFGFATAETERNLRPSLLTEGYFDESGYIRDALDGPHFLFLGYKGSGKSALLNHIDLMSQGRFDRFCRIYQLEDFSFSNFSKIIRGDSEPEAKFPDAWAWLLLILALDSLANDESVRHHDGNAFQATISALRSMGFMPNTNLKNIVALSSRKNFKLTIPYLFEESNEYIKIEKVNDIPLFVSNLKKLMSNIKSNANHYILIDGMDDILTERKVQFKSLGSLIFEIDRLNDFFSKNYVPIKFIVVCRTDLYERISGANKNKIRQDKARNIDWYANPRNPERSMLIDMASRKAQVADQSIIERYFPRKIGATSSEKYLLEHTRYTPRDFLMLLKKISELQKDDERISPNLIMSGIRLYSNDYFIGEIEDELEGYVERPKDWIELLGSFGRRRMRYLDIEDRARRSQYDIGSLPLVLSVLFECSAIGNVVTTNSAEHFTFKYRNRNSRFIIGSDVSVHRGLWKALNIA